MTYSRYFPIPVAAKPKPEPAAPEPAPAPEPEPVPDLVVSQIRVKPARIKAIQLQALLTQQQLAEFLNVSPSCIEDWRLHWGIGPAWIRLSSRAVRYQLSDVQAWIAANRVVPEKEDT